jgi:hypothetical protein
MDDTVPGPAVDTGGCPVIFESPAVLEDVRYAVVANGDIRRDHSGMETCSAGKDTEPIRYWLLYHPDFYGIDPRERWSPGDCSQEFLKKLPPCKDLDFAAKILDGTRDPEIAGLCIDKRAKADTLNNSANRDSARFLHGFVAKFY